MKARTKLSDNFYLDEFTTSKVADEKGIKNTPTDEVVENLSALCANVLQPIRDKANAAISISSGYRCAELNAAVGGVATSQHLSGEAADIYSTKMKPDELFRLVQAMGIEFDQMILYPTFVHISYSEGKNRKQVIRK